jgi:hypothetical protein
MFGLKPHIYKPILPSFVLLWKLQLLPLYSNPSFMSCLGFLWQLDMQRRDSVQIPRRLRFLQTQKLHSIVSRQAFTRIVYRWVQNLPRKPLSKGFLLELYWKFVL